MQAKAARQATIITSVTLDALIPEAIPPVAAAENLPADSVVLGAQRVRLL